MKFFFTPPISCHPHRFFGFFFGVLDFFFEKLNGFGQLSMRAVDCRGQTDFIFCTFYENVLFCGQNLTYLDQSDPTFFQLYLHYSINTQVKHIKRRALKASELYHSFHGHTQVHTCNHRCYTPVIVSPIDFAITTIRVERMVVTFPPPSPLH